MKILNWIKEKYKQRREERDDHDPWWVTLLLDLGRPAVAVLILTMCAPGEHYLAKLVGFGKLSWGMPGALTAYAGIAAVVATKRPKTAPGHRTAVAGALISILAAMAAQPLAHLYQQHVWTLTPVGRVWLTIAVSCVPAAVFGHLLHMGAAPSRTRTVRRTPVRTPKGKTQDKPAVQPDILEDIAPDTRRTPDVGTGSMSAAVRSFLMDNPDASNDELYTEIRRTWPDASDNSMYRARYRFEKRTGT